MALACVGAWRSVLGDEDVYLVRGAADGGVASPTMLGVVTDEASRLAFGLAEIFADNSTFHAVTKSVRITVKK